MNVLVIPEDFRKDEHVLVPILAAIFAAAGKPRANIRVCKDPLLGSVNQALKWTRIEEILSRYRGMTQVFLLIVDRDGQERRREQLDRLEAQASGVLSPTQLFLAENAWQEIEVWALAGADLPAEWSWSALRAEPHPKEAYYLPYAAQRGVDNLPGEGRKLLARESAANYRRVRSRCPEDVASLEVRLSAWFAAGRTPA